MPVGRSTRRGGHFCIFTRSARKSMPSSRRLMVSAPTVRYEANDPDARFHNNLPISHEQPRILEPLLVVDLCLHLRIAMRFSKYDLLHAPTKPDGRTAPSCCSRCVCRRSDRRAADRSCRQVYGRLGRGRLPEALGAAHAPSSFDLVAMGSVVQRMGCRGVLSESHANHPLVTSTYEVLDLHPLVRAHYCRLRSCGDGIWV